LEANVAAHGIGDLGQRESGDLHDSSHLPLCFINALQDF
jgi:hypothetical protein